LLGGLWHGAALRFIIWGAIHGVILAIEKFLKSVVNIPSGKLTRFLGVILTFHIVCFSWIFFRADNMEIVGQVLTQITGNFHPEIIGEFLSGYKLVVLFMFIGYLLHFMPESLELKTEKLVSRSPFLLKIVYLSLIIFLVIQIKSSEIQPFIYFQF
jgi:alginate O-acetyltransferase complex protein AlgI